MFSKTAFRFHISTIVLWVLGIFPLSAAFAQEGRYQGWHMGPGMMGDWGMGWFGGIFMMAFWILIVVGLVLVIRWLVQATSKKGDSGQPASGAIDILKERYARGEIDKAQFETMKRDLAD